jgi:hypothetical protein
LGYISVFLLNDDVLVGCFLHLSCCDFRREITSSDWSCDSLKGFEGKHLSRY